MKGEKKIYWYYRPNGEMNVYGHGELSVGDVVLNPTWLIEESLGVCIDKAIEMECDNYKFYKHFGLPIPGYGDVYGSVRDDNGEAGVVVRKYTFAETKRILKLSKI